MSNIVKNSFSSIIISIFFAPIILALFSWFGVSVVSNREVRVLLPTLIEGLHEIKKIQGNQNNYQLKILKLILQNKQDIAVLNNQIKK